MACGVASSRVFWFWCSRSICLLHAQRRHTVQSGPDARSDCQTISSVSVTNLAAANGLKKTSNLRVGQVLRVPSEGCRVRLPGPDPHRHCAKLNKVSVKALAKANRHQTRPRRCASDERLVLPGYSVRTPRPPSARNSKFSAALVIARATLRARKPLRVRSSSRQEWQGRPERRVLGSRSFSVTARLNRNPKAPDPSAHAESSRTCGRSFQRPLPSWSSARTARPTKGADATSSRHATGEARSTFVLKVFSNEALRDYCLTLRQAWGLDTTREAASSTSTCATARQRTGWTGVAPGRATALPSARCQTPEKSDGETADRGLRSTTSGFALRRFWAARCGVA